MGAEKVYGSSPVKRQRATKTEKAARLEALFEITADIEPATVRQVYYQASVRGVVDKTEQGYKMVVSALSEMRLRGRLPWVWIADNTRWQRRPTTYNSVEDALEETAAFYRKPLWNEADVYVEIWLEKDALSGVIYPITERYDVPLMVARGYSSLSFLHASGEAMTNVDKPCYVYYLADCDPSGQDAARNTEARLRELAPYAEIHFEMLAVLPSQIDAWNLPTRPTKTSDSRSKGFSDTSVELDAIHPDVLRNIVQEAILHHMPPDEFRILKVAEESERELIKSWVAALTEPDEVDEE
jgi:hypothetical protein